MTLFEFVRSAPGSALTVIKFTGALIDRYAWIIVIVFVLVALWEIYDRLTDLHREEGCVFCDIVAGDAPATVVRRWRDAIAIVPIDPVTDDHVLVLPRRHVRDAREIPRVTARVMKRSAQLARGYKACNIVTSCGPEATQTVFHEHVHVYGREYGDSLALAWPDNREAP
jgi:histidine triad (HIT) family protein